MQRKRGRPRKVSFSAAETEAQPDFVPETDLQSTNACPGAMKWTEGSEDQGGGSCSGGVAGRGRQP